MQWLGMRVRSRTARTSCCCETAATTPLVLATSTEVGSMSGVTTIDTGARSAVTAATGRNAGRTESAVQHDTNSAATAVLTRRALIVANSTVSVWGSTRAADGPPRPQRTAAARSAASAQVQPSSSSSAFAAASAAASASSSAAASASSSASASAAAAAARPAVASTRVWGRQRAIGLLRVR